MADLLNNNTAAEEKQIAEWKNQCITSLKLMVGEMEKQVVYYNEYINNADAIIRKLKEPVNHEEDVQFKRSQLKIDHSK